MGAATSKPMREAPVRYVAKQLPKVDKKPMEIQFKKPEYSKLGINKREDDVNTEPLMYVETAKDGSNTELTDHVAPRWYLNTYLEMMDNQREERVIISGNLPLSWERDKYEPYSLVRGRIDEEDLDWVLSSEARKMPMDELLQHTKLDRESLQDLLDTVEAPRKQFRNYKGKLHKAVESANEHLAARKVQIEKAREAEVLRSIGYSEEDVAKESQYLTNRSRGVKTLDELGVSIRSKKRSERANQQDEMERMLEERRINMIESGTYEPTAEEIGDRPERLDVKVHPMKIRTSTHKNMYRADMNKDDRNMAKVQWWLDRTRRVRRGKDTIHGVPIYNDRLATNDAQTRDQMREAAEFNFSMGQAQGAKGFTDPRGHFDDFMKIMSDNKEGFNTSQVEVHSEGAEEQLLNRFPHTASHPSTPKADLPNPNPNPNPSTPTTEAVMGEPNEPFDAYFLRMRKVTETNKKTSEDPSGPPKPPGAQ
jgi:hypothetical protein